LWILNNKAENTITFLWLILVILSLSLSFLKIGQLDIRTGEQWDDYYTLITSDAAPVESFLSDQNLDNYVSLNRSVISYNDISEMKTVPLKDIEDRFHILDPRLDPYMKKVANLFYGHSDNVDYHLIYLKSDSISLYSLYLLLYQQFSQSETMWRISGFEPINIYSPIIVYSLFAILSVFLMKQKKVPYVVSFSCWIPFVYLFGFPAVATALIFSSLFCRKKSLLYMGAVFIVLFLYAFYSSMLSGVFYLALFTGLIGNSYFLFSRKGKIRAEKSISSWKWKRSKIKFRKPDHELFSPVRIMVPGTKKTVVDKINPPQVTVTVLFLVLVTILSVSVKEEESLVLPFAVEKENLSWTLEGVSKTVDRDSLITPADYITHIAYHEGFLYGTEWAYPDSDNPLLYPVFQSEEKGFSKSYEILADYSGKWFNERVSVLNNDNPATLLFSTKRPGTVIKKMNHYKYQSFILLKISFSMLILLLLIFSNRKKYKNISFSVKNKLLRRNAQVA